MSAPTPHTNIEHIPTIHWFYGLGRWGTGSHPVISPALLQLQGYQESHEWYSVGVVPELKVGR